MSAPSDEPLSSRTLRGFIPRAATVAPKRTRAERRVSIIAEDDDSPAAQPHKPKRGVLRRGKTVLKRAVSGGGAAFGVRKSISVQEGLRLKPREKVVDVALGRNGGTCPPDLGAEELSVKRNTNAEDNGIRRRQGKIGKSVAFHHHPDRPAEHQATASEETQKNVAEHGVTHSPKDPSTILKDSTDNDGIVNGIDQFSSEENIAATGIGAHSDRNDEQPPSSATEERPIAGDETPISNDLAKGSEARHSYRKNSYREGSEPDDGGTAYESRVGRVARTGFVERSVAAAVISAARERKKKLKPAANRPHHHRPHGGYCNPWDSALKENGVRARGGSGSRTFFHKVAKDRRPLDEELASMLLLAARPNFDEGRGAISHDKYALASHWIGHCTFLLQAHGITVLTDPVWATRLGPLGPKRLVPPPCEINDLPQTIDVVILSNACYDSFDKHAVQMLASRVTCWLVPIGVKALVVANGIPDAKIVELDWWEEHTVKGTKFICTPAQHYSIRDDALWCSWYVRAPHHRFFFCGGTGYRSVNSEAEDSSSFEFRESFGGPSCPVFKEVCRRYGRCDTAFLPIGGYRPRPLMSGVQGDAVDMLYIHGDLRARRSVVHRWGTFACSSDEGMLDALRLYEAALAAGPVKEQDSASMRQGRLHIT